MTTRCQVSALTAALSLLLGGCAGDVEECRFGSDCASGICNSVGRCVPADGQPDSDEPDATAPGDDAEPHSEPDASEAGGDDGEGSTLGDSVAETGAQDVDEPDSAAPDGSPPTEDSADEPDSASDSCWPNHDEQIDLAEFPAAPGLVQSYLRATDVAVDTDGTDWDLSEPFEGDQEVSVTLEPLADQWFAETYPGASYVAPITGEASLRGVYELTDTQLLLRGVVSESDELGEKTELTYTPPAVVMTFPFEVGDSWTSTSTITGVYPLGIAYYFETHASEVDTQGTMNTPLADFEVLRIRSEMTRTVGLVVDTRRNHFHVAECFGVVSSITSHLDEADEDFSAAAEVRRITP